MRVNGSAKPLLDKTLHSLILCEVDDIADDALRDDNGPIESDVSRELPVVRHNNDFLTPKQKPRDTDKFARLRMFLENIEFDVEHFLQRLVPYDRARHKTIRTTTDYNTV